MLSVDGVEMVDVREAAALVQRTPETVRRWAWTHRIEAVKHGNKLLFRRDDVLRLGREGVAGTAPSLEEWAARVRATRVSGAAGASSRDLVLADRALREGDAAGAGR